MKRPLASPVLVVAPPALVIAALPGCISVGGIYGGGPSRQPLPPPCAETIRGDWLLEGQGGEPGPAPPAPRPAGATRFTITPTRIVQQDPPGDLGPYRVLGVAQVAVDLGVQGPTPLHVVCNHPDKIEIKEANAPGSRSWFYRRAPR